MLNILCAHIDQKLFLLLLLTFSVAGVVVDLNSVISMLSS